MFWCSFSLVIPLVLPTCMLLLCLTILVWGGVGTDALPTWLVGGMGKGKGQGRYPGYLTRGRSRVRDRVRQIPYVPGGNIIFPHTTYVTGKYVSVIFHTGCIQVGMLTKVSGKIL